MGNAQGQNHLVFPQGDGVDQGGLDLLHHHIVIVLDQADLGRSLDGDSPGQLQIVDLLLKPVALVGQIPCFLGIFSQARLLSDGLQLHQLAGTNLLELLLARQDVHGQFLEIGQILVIQLIQHSRILQQPHLVLLQGIADFGNIHFRLGEAGLHGLQLVRLLLKQAQQALLLLGIEALQLAHHIHDQIAHLTQVLGAHIVQCGIGEIRHLLLGGSAILQNLGRIFHIDLGCKGIHQLLLFGGQHRLRSLGHRRLLHRNNFGCSIQIRLQRQAGYDDFLLVLFHSVFSSL